jgi:hypothetical protein
VDGGTRGALALGKPLRGFLKRGSPLHRPGSYKSCPARAERANCALRFCVESGEELARSQKQCVLSCQMRTKTLPQPQW